MVSLPDGDRLAYRIVSNRYPPFDGAGAHRYGSRWISPGRWVIHAAGSYALAVLENLVHWQRPVLPPTLVYTQITVPASIEQESTIEKQEASLSYETFDDTRALGDAWYERGNTAVLWVPSVVSPHEVNLLINQHHPDTPRIQVGDTQPVSDVNYFVRLATIKMAG